MIRWCCYCQTLIGEALPLVDYEISHGVCGRCSARLDSGEPLIAEYESAGRFYRDLFAAARAADPSTCAELAKRGAAAGFGYAEILIGIVQPALSEIGHKWETGEVTIADEHRFTAWCETMLAHLERPAAPAGPLDLLIVQAPGNRHELGARIAEQVLLAAGIRAMGVWPELPVDEIRGLIEARRPAWLGFSCALPGMVDAARDVARELRAGGFRGGVLLSGQAFRRTPEAWSPCGAEICPTVDSAIEVVRRSRPA